MSNAAARFTAVAAMIVALLCFAPPSGAQVTGKWGGAIDPDALQILKGMTDYLGGLGQFSLHTENIYDEVLETGQKIQFQYSSDVVIQRPDKLLVQRTDGLASQLFVYDGAALTMSESEQGFFATVDAPANIDDLLHFARDVLDIVPPAGDMVYTNSFELLTAAVTSGLVIGPDVVEGVACHHLAFTTPVVDWQVWIAEGDAPLPLKYVLTTKDDPAQPQFITFMSEWNTAREIDVELFVFEPEPTAIEIDFVLADGTTSAR